MLIAIFSDTHDHMHHMRTAIDQLKERGITIGIHLGDFCAPPALELLADSGLHWYGVWGNVDGDRLMSWLRIKDKGTVDIGTDDFHTLELEGRKLFLTHYPDIAKIAAISGEFDAVFHGHNHKAAAEMIKTNGGPHSETLLANPGELCGFRYGTPTYGIYDTEQNTLEHVQLSP